MSHRMNWPAGSPFDYAECGYCRAPIVRGQLEHTCQPSGNPGELEQAQRIAAQQAEMVAEVEARIDPEANCKHCKYKRYQHSPKRLQCPWPPGSRFELR